MDVWRKHHHKRREEIVVRACTLGGESKWGLRIPHEAHDRSLGGGVSNVGKHGRQVLCFQARELILAEFAEVLMRAVFNKRCNFGSSKQGEESNECRAEETNR